MNSIIHTEMPVIVKTKDKIEEKQQKNYQFSTSLLNLIFLLSTVTIIIIQAILKLTIIRAIVVSMESYSSSLHFFRKQIHFT